MKKHIGLLLLLSAMLLLFTGCGGSTDGSGGNDGAKEPEKEITVFNTWVASDIVTKENGKEVMTTEDWAQYAEKDISDLAKINIYEDGTGDISLFAEEAAPLKWTPGEKENQYILSPDYGTEEGEDLTITFKEGKVTLIIAEESTVTDGEGNKTTSQSETTMTLVPAKERDSKNTGLEMQLSDEQTRAMSIFMNEGMFLNVDGVLYATFQPLTFVMAELDLSKDKIAIKEPKVIEEKCLAKYLTAKGDYIYAVLLYEGEDDTAGIVKIKKGTDKMETVYDKPASYLQIVGDNLYFTDENHNFVKTDLDGKKKSIIIEKDCYYPYFLDEEHILYQDDKDGETLHMYNSKTKEDKRITEGKCYAPVINGETLYYAKRMDNPKEDSSANCNFARYNLYTGRSELYEKEFTSRFFIVDDTAYFAFGTSAPCKLPQEWNKLYDKAFAGSNIYVAYADDDIFIRKNADISEAYCYKRGDEQKEGKGILLKLEK